MLVNRTDVVEMKTKIYIFVKKIVSRVQIHLSVEYILKRIIYVLIFNRLLVEHILKNEESMF